MLRTKTVTASLRCAEGRPFGSVVARPHQQVDCVLLNAQEHCALPESLAGYEAALRAAGVGLVRVSAGPLPWAKTILIPACLALPSEAAREVAAQLKDGSCVVLESGAGFAAPKEFAAHQEWLREAWSVEVKAPVDLWKAERRSALRRRSNNQLGDDCRLPIADRRLSIKNSHCNFLNRQSSIENRQFPSPLAPYVDFHWPLKVKVRDFSRAVPVSADAEHIVGWCGHWPIASKQTAGNGTLVFLGSPLGPALWAGDAEAHRWLRKVLDVRR
jgi:hypothetical protein